MDHIDGAASLIPRFADQVVQVAKDRLTGEGVRS